MSTPGSARRQCRRCDIAIGPNVTFCTPCVKQNKRDRKRIERANQPSGYASLSNHRQRARHFGVAYEPIKPQDIYDRDGWICGICHDPIDRELDYPDPMSASLDHVQPMALGGSHTHGNVQAAHFICNSKKAHRVTGAARALIG